jgi:anti-sigma-K factor RskA
MSVQKHELHLLTGSYALDALPADEQADFEKHLSRCPACAEEVRGLRETTARLGIAAASVPPPAMRERVLAAAPRIRQLPPDGHAATRWRGRLRGQPVARAGIATSMLALAAAAVFLLVTTLSTSSQLHQVQQQSNAVAAVLSAADAHPETLAATTGGEVKAIVSVSEQEAVVTTRGVPALSSSKVYQLWVVTPKGVAKSAGLLKMTGSGTTSPVLASAIVAGDRLAITVEPAGGSAQPTTIPVAALKVTA